MARNDRVNKGIRRVVSPGKRTHRINLHDTYGVSWTPDKIVRDLIQNFYDSVPEEEFEKAIQIEADGRHKTVRISGPKVFDVELLWRIGVGTKTGDISGQYAGGFGEGFAVAALQLLRNWPNLVVYTTVGNEKVTFRLEEIEVSEMRVRELVCDVEQWPGKGGTELVLENAPAILTAIFAHGKSYFDYPQNPIFGEKLSDDEVGRNPERWSRFCRHETCSFCAGYVASIRASESESSDCPPAVSVYLSRGKTGAIFYRRQVRAHLDIPLVITCRTTLSRVGLGRDRADLNKKEIERILEHSLVTLGPDAIQKLVLDQFRPYWERGHFVLEMLSGVFSPFGPHQMKGIEFPKGFYARRWQRDEAVEAARAGAKLCPHYMTSFGMPDTQVFSKAAREVQKRAPRMFALEGDGQPSVVADEITGFNILREAYEAIFARLVEADVLPPGAEAYSEFRPNFGTRTLNDWKMLVFDGKGAEDELQGLMAEKTLTLNSAAFQMKFPAAFSVFVHEASHKFGGDGSYNFGGALKHAMAAVAADPAALDPIEDRWEQNRKQGASIPEKLDGLAAFTAHYASMSLHDKETASFVRAVTSRALTRLLGCELGSTSFKLKMRPQTLTQPDRKIAALLLYLYAESLCGSGSKSVAEPDHIRDLCQAALRFDPSLEAARDRLYMQAVWEEDDFDTGRDLITEGLKHTPQSAGLFFRLGEVEWFADNYRESAAAFLAALEIEPDSPEYVLLAARSLAWAGEWVRAYSLLLPLLSRDGRQRARLELPPGVFYQNVERLLCHPALERWIIRLGTDLETDFRRKKAFEKQSTDLLAEHFLFYFILSLHDRDARDELQDVGDLLKKRLGKERARACLLDAYSRVQSSVHAWRHVETGFLHCVFEYFPEEVRKQETKTRRAGKEAVVSS